MVKSLLLLSLALAFSVETFVVPADAAPERVEGLRCNSVNAANARWIGFFSGYREDPIISNGDDRRINVTVWRCFKTKADCTAWKYWMQTDYLAGGQATWCRRK